MTSDSRAERAGGAGGAPLAQALAEAGRRLAARRPADALAVLEALPGTMRRDPRALAAAAYAFSLQGRMAEALAAARAAVAGELPDLAALEMAGASFTLCQRPAEAYAVFRRAAALAPDEPAILFNLAATARFLGRAEEAEAAYDRLIARAPQAWAAWRNRSELRRQTPERNHVAALQGALARGPGPDAVVQLGYALGKELEDLGDYDSAFAALRRGAEARRSRMRYDVEADAGSLGLIAEVFDATWCAPARPAAAGEGPIFILGMPRTGSTLLERMLGRHSQVQPLGELQSFGAAVIGQVRAARPTPPADKAELIRATAALPSERIGEAYLAAVAPLRDARPRFTDKLPLNFLYAGLIARALPGARIVHLTRDPLDACVAIYKTLFEEAYPFSYDLAELGTYWRAYAGLMDHWRAALGGRLVEVAYERLVADPAAELAALLPRLGLDFEPACLAPEAGEAPVMTASASQVREAVHDRSVGAAARYRAHLGPLIAALGDCAVRATSAHPGEGRDPS
jgi:tetratricopeptide (TPR) repeat protein